MEQNIFYREVARIEIVGNNVLLLLEYSPRLGDLEDSRGERRELAVGLLIKLYGV